MPVDVSEAVQFVQDILSDRQVKKTVGGALKGAACVGVSAGFCALLLGPVGLAIGGAAGGIGAAMANKDEFLPLPQVIADMPIQQKQALAERVERIVQNVNATDVAMLGMMFVGNTALRDRVALELLQYMTQEMQLAIS